MEKSKDCSVQGMHGWDPEAPEMHALFIAAGPDIPGCPEINELKENLKVYWVIKRLLGISE